MDKDKAVGGNAALLYIECSVELSVLHPEHRRFDAVPRAASTLLASG
jgi:hypothetical protein